MVAAFRASCCVVFAASVGVSLAPNARADIVGFNNLIGWEYNQGDSGSPADLPDPGTIQFTSGNGQRRSLFFRTPQNVSEFTASFTYRVSNTRGCLTWQGITFCVQNDARGADALGGGNGSLGYSGIAPSAAVTLMLDSGPGRSYSALWTNGNAGGGQQATTPVNAYDLRPLEVTITYSDPIMRVVIDDPAIPGTEDFVRNYVLGDLESLLGGTNAFVGFTTSTGDLFGNGGLNQYLSDFRFTTVPSPGTLPVMARVGLALTRRRRIAGR